MKRIDNVFAYVKAKSERNDRGVTTTDVADELQIQRTNASKDLNRLVEEGRLRKLSGRPVRYTTVSSVQSSHKIIVIDKVQHTVPSNLEDSGSFDSIIGATGSMKTPVEQAKASILYPPKGLNCLITGGTGTGKTHFVQVMFQFAKEQGLIEQDKELVIFNCADYANNSELLMSQLFGFAEGAFTGANQAREGLMHQADGGMLFLDEVHRLPPEGQEMIFSYMDFGTYHRLGETNQSQSADVRIVCATTENVSSFLLQTFLRRIPIHIQLPSFVERPAKEKIELVQTMLTFEATRLKRKISLTDSVVKALIGSVTFGNVGQLKSNVQLMCAYCFLKQMEQHDMVITIEDLSPTLRDGLMLVSSNQQGMSELTKWLDPMIVVQPNQNQFSLPEDAYELPYNLYDIIGDKATILQQDGVNQETINHYILTDINVHLKSFYRQQGFTFENDNRLSEIIDNKIIEVAKDIREKVEEALSIKYSDEFIYALSLHVGALLKRVDEAQGERKDNVSIKKMVLEFPDEYKIAKKIHGYLSETFLTTLPSSEVDYLTVLLVSQRKMSRLGCIGIVVAAHGISTASSMVQVVQQLMGYEHIQAVDMPLNVSPNQTLEKIISAVLKVDSGSGVLLLVDMGSLANFGDKIEQQTNVKIKTIDMVSTPLVLEASRKASYQDGSLDLLYDELSSFRGYGRMSDEVTSTRQSESNTLPPAIVTFCASGEGTAVKMKQTVEGLLSDKFLLEIEIIPLSIVDAQESIAQLQKRYNILLSVGIQPPDFESPHISIAKLLSKDGEQYLNHLIENRMFVSESVIEREDIDAKEMCLSYMQQNSLFLNPNQFFEPLWILAQTLITAFNVKDTEDSLCFSLVLHTSGSIERIIHNETLSVEKHVLLEYVNSQTYELVRKCLTSFEEQFNLSFPQEEEYYMYQILQQASE